MPATNENSPSARSLFAKVFVRSWEYRAPRLLWGLRIAVSLAVALGVILLAFDCWWGLLALAAAPVFLFLGSRIYQIARSQPAA